MRIVVLSDSHCTSLADLPVPFVAALQTADMIIHAGDYTGWQLVQELQQLTRFYGVAGNMDSSLIASELPDQAIVEVEGYHLGIIHGWGKGEGLAQRVRGRFPADINVIVYGHSHLAKKEQADGTLLFNPGSAIGRFPASYASYGLITIDEKGLQAEIVRI